MNDEQRLRLEAALWSDPSIAVCAVLDAATVPEFIDRLYASPQPEFECLMGGFLEPDLAYVSPYAVRLERGTRFSDWVLGSMWGEHWGILARGTQGFGPLARHFRSMFVVYGPQHEPMYFRFYDPRALRLVLPGSTPEQLAEMFAPVRDVWMEGEQPGAITVLQAPEGVLAAREIRIDRL